MDCIPSTRRFAPYLLCLLGLWGAKARTQAQPAEPIRAAVVSSFFLDVPKTLAESITESFGSVLREATGMSCEVALADSPFDLASRLQAGKLDFGVFHGVEFAWVRQKHPDLIPLMVAVNKQRSLRAYLLVRKDSGIAGLADLKNKNLALPTRSAEHCRLFLEQKCQACGQVSAEEFLDKIVVAPSVEDALDDLCGKKVQAAVVDERGLDFYKDLKPGCFARLKIAAESQPFPPHVVVYRSGTFDEATLQRLRSGLTDIPNLEEGRTLLKLWKVHAFESVPAQFAQRLIDIDKAYPAPRAGRGTPARSK
jgi:ABC-type phosphate/phosphonate transport system substrate-binding protein